MASGNISVLVERHGTRFNYLDRRLNRATDNQEKGKRVLMRELVRFDLRYATEKGYSPEQRTGYSDELSPKVHAKQLELAAMSQELRVFNAWSIIQFFNGGLIGTLGCGLYASNRLYELLIEIQNQLPETDRLALDMNTYKIYLGVISSLSLGAIISRAINMIKAYRIRKATKLAEQEVLNSIDFSKMDEDRIAGLVRQIREERHQAYQKIDEELSFIDVYISLLYDINSNDQGSRLMLRVLALREDRNLGIVLDNLSIDQIQQLRADVKEATSFGELAAIVRKIENIEGIERHHSEPTF